MRVPPGTTPQAVGGVVLDTSGDVFFPKGLRTDRGTIKVVEWSDLSPFEQGYVKRALEGLAIWRRSDSGVEQTPKLVRRTGRLHYDGEWFPPEMAFADVDGGNIPLREIADPSPASSTSPGLPRLAYEDELKDVAFSDLHPETLAAIRKDCAAGSGGLRYDAPETQAAFDREAGALRWRASGLTPFLDDEGKVRLRESADTSEQSDLTREDGQ